MAGDAEYIPISCGDYEAFEIACMDGYHVELTTRDGRKVVGKAVDLAVRPPEEFLVIRHDDGTSEEIRVDHVGYMAVLSRPRRFDDHTFAS
jgi:transcriptional antiterminator Rof (Rho-off)